MASILASRTNRVNLNGNQGGGNKKQGIPSKATMFYISSGRGGWNHFLSGTYGPRRDWVFCMNQLSGVGASRSMFKIRGLNKPDAARKCRPHPYRERGHGSATGQTVDASPPADDASDTSQASDTSELSQESPDIQNLLAKAQEALVAQETQLEIANTELADAESYLQTLTTGYENVDQALQAAIQIFDTASAGLSESSAIATTAQAMQALQAVLSAAGAGSLTIEVLNAVEVFISTLAQGDLTPEAAIRAVETTVVPLISPQLSSEQLALVGEAFDLLVGLVVGNILTPQVFALLRQIITDYGGSNPFAQGALDALQAAVSAIAVGNATAAGLTAVKDALSAVGGQSIDSTLDGLLDGAIVAANLAGSTGIPVPAEISSALSTVVETVQGNNNAATLVQSLVAPVSTIGGADLKPIFESISSQGVIQILEESVAAAQAQQAGAEQAKIDLTPVGGEEAPAVKAVSQALAKVTEATTNSEAIKQGIDQLTENYTPEIESQLELLVNAFLS